MIELIWPEAALVNEWPRMATVLKPAVIKDTRRTWFDVCDRLMTGTFQAWRFEGGYFVTEIYEGGPFWIIYAASEGQTLKTMRALLAELETAARKAGCRTIRFDGRDWRRIAKGYDATRDGDGTHHFSKVLSDA